MPTFQQVLDAIRQAKESGNINQGHIDQINAVLTGDGVHACPTCGGKGVAVQDGQGAWGPIPGPTGP